MARIRNLFWWGLDDVMWIAAREEGRDVSYWAGFSGEVSWESSARLGGWEIGGKLTYDPVEWLVALSAYILARSSCWPKATKAQRQAMN